MNTNQGAAYVFTRSDGAWSQTQKLAASDAAAGDLFGFSVALDAETAVIGASGKDKNAATGAGAAYVFTLSGGTWTPQQKLLPDISAADNFFGAAVAVSGDTALIGSFGDDIGANADQGSAVVFVRSGSTWTKQQKLTTTDGAAGDKFGLSRRTLRGHGGDRGDWRRPRRRGSRFGLCLFAHRRGMVPATAPP